MKIEIQDFRRYIIILLTVFTATMIILSSDSMIVHIAVLFILTVIAVLQSKFNFSHPYFWFSSFFFLYNCAYMIILIIAPQDSAAKGYNTECGFLIILALSVSLLLFNPHIYEFDYKLLPNPEKYEYDIKILGSLMWLFLIIQIVTSFILFRQGVTIKSVQWKEHNMLWIIATYCTRFNAYILAILVFMGGNLKKKIIVIIGTLAMTLFFSLLTGERDAILRLVIIFILCLAMIGKIRFKQLLIIVPVGIAGMILLNYFKYYLRTGLLNRDTFTFSNTLYEFLYSDFVDCGSNLQVLTSHPELRGCKGLGIIFADLLSSFAPARIMNLIYGNVTAWNMSEWYNDYFYRGSTWSRAFTIVGEGYVIAGAFGVVIVFSLIGILVRFLYKRACKNPYFAAVYIYSAVTIISSFRGDMATIFSFIVRTPVFLSVIIWFLKKILYREHFSNL